MNVSMETSGDGPFFGGWGGGLPNFNVCIDAITS